MSCVPFGYGGCPPVSRETAGAAIRALRESRDWSLADLAAASGVSTMGLSYLERGTRKPQKATVQKVENGLGLPPGTYSRLVVADDPDAELAQLLASSPTVPPAGAVAPGSVAVSKHTVAGVLEASAEAQLETLISLIERLPRETSNEYEMVIQSAIIQCVKAENLAANSWRVAVDSDAGESTDRLMAHLKAMEKIRCGLLARLPGGIGGQFDRACGRSGLPDPVIAVLLGVTAEEMWDIRTRGVIPPAALARVAAFAAGES